MNSQMLMLNQIPMLDRIPMLNMSLHVAPDFTGRILLYIVDGELKCETRLMSDEIVGTPKLFSELLERAGYRMNPINKG